MKNIKLTMAILGTFVMLSTTNSSLEANQGRPQEVIAIQIDKPAPKNIKRVQVQERENAPEKVRVQERKQVPEIVQVQQREKVPQRVRVQERDSERAQLQERRVQQRQKRCYCENCQRRIIKNKRPEYHGRVPVGQRVGRYGQGVVVYPCGRTPKKVLVHPAPPCCCEDEYSITWSVTTPR